MLKKLIGNRIQFRESVSDWKEAIKVAADPLLKEGYIKTSYIEGIIENVEQNGSYIIILPEIALPHARPEKGAVNTGMSYLSLEKPVAFPDGSEVKLFFTLAAVDDNIHLDAMGVLAEVLMEDERMAALFACQDAEKVKDLLTL